MAWEEGSIVLLNILFINPTSFDVISNKINSGVPGEYTFQGNDVIQPMTTLAPGKDYQVYGDLTFKAEGKLFINNDGSWNFNGNLKVYDDIYDFTVTRNDWLAPKRFGRNVQTLGLANYKYENQGTPYNIQIRGEKSLQGDSGPSSPMVGQGGLSTNGNPQSRKRPNLNNGPLLK